MSRGCLVLLACLSSGCLGHAGLAHRAPPRPMRASLVQVACASECSLHEVDVWSDGTVVHEPTGRNAPLAPEQMGVLVQAFHEANFFALQGAYGRCGPDEAVTTLSFSENGVRKSVVACGDRDIPDALVRLTDRFRQIADVEPHAVSAR